jgi:hypothetical protein
VLAHKAQVEDGVDPTEQMAVRHSLLKAGLIEQCRLLGLLSQHGSAPSPHLVTGRESRGTSPTQSLFQQLRTFDGQAAASHSTLDRSFGPVLTSLMCFSCIGLSGDRA